LKVNIGRGRNGAPVKSPTTTTTSVQLTAASGFAATSGRQRISVVRGFSR
jgi:hypothetical protein